MNEIMLHGTLLPESIFNVVLASLISSCPQTSPNLTKSSSHFLRCDCMCLYVWQEGRKEGYRGEEENASLLWCFISGIRMDSIIYFLSQYVSHLNEQIKIYCIYVIDKMNYVILLIKWIQSFYILYIHMYDILITPQLLVY